VNHADAENLMLYAWGELAEADTAPLEEHLASCPACRAELGTIERGVVALTIARPRSASARRRLAAAVSLLAAAAIAGVVIARETPRPTDNRRIAEAVILPAGYVAGGPHLVALDSILVKLGGEMFYVDQ
jgi:anti-sigma factor RsiW